MKRIPDIIYDHPTRYSKTQIFAVLDLLSMSKYTVNEVCALLKIDTDTMAAMSYMYEWLGLEYIEAAPHAPDVQDDKDPKKESIPVNSKRKKPTTTNNVTFRDVLIFTLTKGGASTNSISTQLGISPAKASVMFSELQKLEILAKDTRPKTPYPCLIKTMTDVSDSLINELDARGVAYEDLLSVLGQPTLPEKEPDKLETPSSDEKEKGGGEAGGNPVPQEGLKQTNSGMDPSKIPFLKEAIEFTMTSSTITASLLTSKFRIGKPHAKNIIQEMVYLEILENIPFHKKYTVRVRDKDNLSEKARKVLEETEESSDNGTNGRTQPF